VILTFFTVVFGLTLSGCRSAGGRLVGPDGGIVQGRPPQKVRVIVPPGSLTSPTTITCRLIGKERVRRPPQLHEGQALVSRIVEVTPSALKFRRYSTLRFKTSLGIIKFCSLMFVNFLFDLTFVLSLLLLNDQFIEKNFCKVKFIILLEDFYAAVYKKLRNVAYVYFDCVISKVSRYNTVTFIVMMFCTL